MKQVNNIIVTSCECKNGWENAPDRKHVTKISARNITLTLL